MIADHQIKKDQDAIMAEYLEKFRKAHEAKVETKYGNTYVAFEKIDFVTERYIEKLKQLFELMELEYSVSMSKHSQFDISGEDEFCFIVFNDDAKRAEFIKKFVDNGYRLTY